MIRTLLASLFLALGPTILPLLSQTFETEINPQGIVFPKMSSAARNSLSAVSGQCVFDTDTKQLECYDGTKWIASSITLISDEDGDTRIEVEKTQDDDKIRFFIKDKEELTLRHNIAGDLIIDYSGSNDSVAQWNTFFGLNAGNSNTTGNASTYFGYNAGSMNTRGKENTFVGNLSGFSNTDGTGNTFLGTYSGQSNLEGNHNTFVGNYAGYLNTVGDINTFIGFASGNNTTTGARNTFIGARAGLTNSSGYENVLIGNSSGRFNKGWRNTIIGSEAGYSADSISNCVFIGYNAGYNEINDHRLYIESDYRFSLESDVNTPLIYGEFDNDKVEINGSLKVRDVLNLTALSTEPVGSDSGDIYLDDGSNTTDSLPGFRWFNGSIWVDL